jgi:hypothetical protein
MAPEGRDDRVHTQDVVLDIGDGVGALVLYTGPELRGREIEVSRKGTDGPRVHSDIKERRVNGRPIFAAVYDALPAGDYVIWTDDPGPTREVTIVSGQISEVDWRR